MPARTYSNCEARNRGKRQQGRIRKYMFQGAIDRAIDAPPRQIRDAANEGLISRESSRIAVRVIHTDGELMIAKTVCGVLGLGSQQGV
jgi:acetate kinase